MKIAKGVLEVKVMKLTGELLNIYSKNVTAEPNSSNNVFSVDMNEMLKGTQAGDVFVRAEFKEAGKQAYVNNYFLTKQKDVNYPAVTITKNIKRNSGGYEIQLTSDKFARAVFMSINGIDNFFENNYFDILPGETVTVKVNTNISLSDFNDQLKIVSLIDGF